MFFFSNCFALSFENCLLNVIINWKGFPSPFDRLNARIFSHFITFKLFARNRSSRTGRILQLFRERLSEKEHATIPKGIVDGFVFTLRHVLQGNLKE